MWARITDYVGSRIAQTAKQGKTACRSFLSWVKGLTANEDLKKDAWTVLVVLGVGVGSWCFGRLSVTAQSESAGVEIKDVFKDAQDRFVCKSPEAQDRPVSLQGGGEGTSISSAPAEGSVVGSKNGTKYHLPHCSGAGSIKEENKVWFASESAAQAAGYTRAGNCK